MTAAPASPDAASSEPRSDEVRWQLDTLRALGDLGMRLAHASVAEAEALAAAPDAAAARSADPALAFSRISRAVRLTVMLHARALDGRLGEAGRAAAIPDPDLGSRDAQARAELEDRRLTGQLRRSMTRFIAGTAVEALDREAPETERLLDAVDERLDREGPDDAAFADIDVEDLAWTICQELGIDPGPDWWAEGWGIQSPPPRWKRGGGGPRSGGGGRPTAASEQAPVSAPSPQTFRSG